MIIKSLIRYKCDLELRWLHGHYDHLKAGRRVTAQFFDCDNMCIVVDLPFSMLPFLTPGLVVSRGEVQVARKTGKQYSLVLPNLSMTEEVDAAQCTVLSHYGVNNYIGGIQKILRYQAEGATVLIPAIELIRYLFLHNRILAESLLLPSGLMELAVTPLPGVYTNIQMNFTDRVPQKLITPEFVREFAWLSIDPSGRHAWDSVRRRSGGEHFLALDPPPIEDCCLEFRGVAWDRHWLVLEILSLSGRLLPAQNISWTHPSVLERTRKSKENISNHSQRGLSSTRRPRREREHLLDGISKSMKSMNQDVIQLGGKRGSFSNSAEVISVLGPRREPDHKNPCTENEEPRKFRSDKGAQIDPGLSPVIVRQTVSVDSFDFIDGLPPVEFSVLQQAGWDHIGNLALLNAALERIEAMHQGLTLTKSLYYLKRGTAFSCCGPRRRAYLLAVFTSQECPPRVLIDVDHTDRSELAALLLRYDAPISLAAVADHVQILLGALVDNYGHWDVLVEARLSRYVTIKRLPKLLRMTERAEDEEYVRRWVERLNRELRWRQLSLNDAWFIH